MSAAGLRAALADEAGGSMGSSIVPKTMDDSRAIEEVVELFDGGCACSQAVLASVAESLGLDRGQALRISACFSAGMRTGEVCGAVTGAYMALGLANCGADCTAADGRQAAYEKVASFNDAFLERHGSLLCRELRDAGKCSELVRDAASILEELLSP
jgi:C_GCAxxG_C_C family probable redox protein